MTNDEPAADATLADADPPETGEKPRFSIGRLAPILVIAAGLACYFIFDLGRFVSLDQLRDHRELLTGWVARNGIWAGLVFTLTYVAIAAFSIPAGALASITGGFLFGTIAAAFYIVIGATIGATALFLAARYAFSELLRAKAGPWLGRLQAGFNENGLSYMLTLRLIPVVPFFIVNLVPAFLNVPTRVYVAATFFGIIPGALVYASVGDGIGAVLEQGDDIDLGIIFEPRFLLPIVGLAVLSLLPAAAKWWKARRNREG